MGGVLGLGIILSFYGNQALFEDLARSEGEIEIGEELVVMSELERSDSQGVYAIQIIEEGSVDINILNPYDRIIESKSINEELFEGRFTIETDGVYKMIIKNNGSNPVKVFGVIGAEPDAGTKSLGFVSLYLLVVGLVGMVIVGIFAIKRKRS